jgi:hypothetical protein
MRSDLRPFLEDTLSPASIAKSGYFSAGPINSLWRAFTSGRNDADWSRIWSLAVLIDFINRGRGAFRPPRCDSGSPGMNTLLLAPELFGSEGGVMRMLRLYLKAACELAVDGERVGFVSLNDGLIDPSSLRRYTNDHLGRWKACRRGKLRFIGASLLMGRRSREGHLRAYRPASRRMGLIAAVPRRFILPCGSRNRGLAAVLKARDGSNSGGNRGILRQ